MAGMKGLSAMQSSSLRGQMETAALILLVRKQPVHAPIRGAITFLNSGFKILRYRAFE